MKGRSLQLCLLMILVAAQHSGSGIVIPPFLQHLAYPVSAIGTLFAVGPLLSLAARLPAGFTYQSDRAKSLIAVTLTIAGLCNFSYGYAVHPIAFILVHGLNGFVMGAATTFYLAYFVESLPPEKERHHAMGYYAGALAVGHSGGGLLAGMVADRFGFVMGFGSLAVVTLCALGIFLLIPSGSGHSNKVPARKDGRSLTLRETFQAVINPQMAVIVVIAIFLNMLHQLHVAFLPLYSLAVGLTLTQAGIIKASHALCNAVTRPISGYIVKGFGHRSLSRVALPLQAATLMLIPFFDKTFPLVMVLVTVGFLRAIVLVSNTISIVEDVDETRVSRGVASGVFHAAGDLGVVLGPSVGGVIASFTGILRLFFVGPLLIAGMFLLFLWGSQFFGSPHKPAKEELSLSEANRE